MNKSTLFILYVSAPLIGVIALARQFKWNDKQIKSTNIVNMTEIISSILYKNNRLVKG